MFSSVQRMSFGEEIRDLEAKLDTGVAYSASTYSCHDPTSGRSASRSEFAAAEVTERKEWVKDGSVERLEIERTMDVRSRTVAKERREDRVTTFDSYQDRESRDRARFDDEWTARVRRYAHVLPVHQSLGLPSASPPTRRRGSSSTIAQR